MKKLRSHLPVILTGLVVGVMSILLVLWGNPANMGFCIACFLRDIAGALGMHRAEAVQYIRPEIIGLVLGSMVMAMVNKEFKVRGGSSPVTRFILGGFMMVGALMFLGCPVRMVIRLGGGDLNAIFGLVGFALGIFIGTLFLKKGFTLKKSYSQTKAEGLAIGVVNVGLLVLVIAAPAFLFFSKEGPGSMHAPIVVALIAGLVVGALAQKTRFCMAGGIRDAIMLKDFHLLTGFVALLVTIFIGNLIVGGFDLGQGLKVGFEGQPIAHTDGLWNALGMVLVGFTAVLLGGCPMRQLVLSGSGNSDSTVTVLGMVAGAAICHNFGLASSAAGPTVAGKIAVGVGLVVVTVIGLVNTKKV